MAIAATLQQYLDDQGVTYDLTTHKTTHCASRTAEASHVPGGNLAKAVVIKRREGYLLAVLPASHHVELNQLGHWLQQPVSLATEDEIAGLFPDCDAGAVPAIAPAYNLNAVVDEGLDDRDDIWFEAGDHRTLVHMSGGEFRTLMGKMPHQPIAM
jgi:Ala-tRNA(Pro) deacylase